MEISKKDAKYQWALSEYLNRDICQPEGFYAVRLKQDYVLKYISYISQKHGKRKKKHLAIITKLISQFPW